MFGGIEVHFGVDGKAFVIQLDHLLGEVFALQRRLQTNH